MKNKDLIKHIFNILAGSQNCTPTRYINNKQEIC